MYINTWMNAKAATETTSRESQRSWPRVGKRARRLGLLVPVAVCAFNTLTGAPLAALWVGSRLTPSSGQLTLTVVAVMAATLILAEVVLLRILTALSAAYDRLTGRGAPRRTAPWLRSMRDSGPRDADRERHVTAGEAIIVIAVVAAVAAFEVWFFFFAGNSLPR
jgi:hypothetical protein